MLPERFNLKHLDEGIEELVVNINRLPNINTATTCEGHIWKHTPAWPTKDGWIHFFVEDPEKYQGLLLKLDYWCQEKGYFELENGVKMNEMFIYTIFGKYEPHHDNEFNDLFENMNQRERRNYFRRAETRRKKLLNGWRELNDLIVDYIQNHISEDVKALPYREE